MATRMDPPRSLPGFALLLLVPLVLFPLLGVPRAVRARDEVGLERLLGNLLRAKSDGAVDAALDALSKHSRFRDEGAFADFLGQVAPKKARHPRVLLRRGWAYLAAGRGGDAIAPLELAAKTGKAKPTALAYLGEAHRQAGEAVLALGYLTDAAREGYAPVAFLDEAALKAGFEARRKTPSKDADALPVYAAPMDAYLAVRPGATIHAAVARWMIDDHFAFARDGTERARAWSAHAARHALRAVRMAPSVVQGGRLCLEAARALRWDRPPGAGEGHPLEFECLAWAYRLGRGPDTDRHETPQAIAWLARAALEEGRFELAAKLARERLDMSDSPLAREVLRGLPVEVGD